jgi:hypothetical protein
MIIWHCNRLLQDRNLVIVGAAVMIVIWYYKLQLQYDALKVMLRFLPL